jgi:hypothetical protein
METRNKNKILKLEKKKKVNKSKKLTFKNLSNQNNKTIKLYSK